jgi:hypothetical protein
MSEGVPERGAIEAPGAQRRSQACGCTRPALEGHVL